MSSPHNKFTRKVTTKTSPPSTKTSSPPAPTNIKASDLFVKILTQYGVKQIFGVPGEASPDFMLSLQAAKTIDFILTRHEQGAAFMAYGVARAQMYNGKYLIPGVCLSTEGPGATNLVTGLACANEDQVPVIAITGQVSQAYKRGFQNIDVCGIMQQVSKWSVSISDPNDISEIVAMAFRTALTPPYGVVHIELPTAVAHELLSILPEETPLTVDLFYQFLRPNTDVIARAYQYLSEGKYKQPIILVGPNIFNRTRGDHLAWHELAHFASLTNIGVVVAPGGKGAIDPTNPLYLYALNFTPYDWSNYALLWADVVIAIGYDQAEFGASGWNYRPVPVIHIDTVPAEVGWFYQPLVEVVGDIGSALSELSALVKAKPLPPQSSAAATYQFVQSQWKLSLAYEPDPKTFPKDCVFQGNLSNIIGSYMQEKDGLVILDSGAHQTWVLRNAEFYKPGNIISSNSMASMGVSLPLALGYAMENQRIGDVAKKILVVSGDGGFLMNVQELATIHQIIKVTPNAKIVVMVWNDSALGYVEWAEQQSFGKHFDLTEINPDFQKLGDSFNWASFPEVTSASDVAPTLDKAFAASTSAIFSVKVDTKQNVKFSDWLYYQVAPAVEQNLGVTDLPAPDLQVGRFA